ncbi:MAG: RNA polymerase sigma factor [Lachnospiraceae bacterium]|nr:RNA polymerase sigma factor [Lachnospiraceae bacterium]
MPDISANAEFEAFYERHWQYVYRLCFSYMHSEADAEDCAEDVFVKVLTGSFTFTDETHERKWLCVTASNLCKDRLGSYGRRNVDSLDAEDAPEVTAPEDVEEDFVDVREAVLSLPPKLKDVVWMYYYDGYPTDEIAAALGRPPSTVRNQLRDARKKLEKTLRNYKP